MNECFSACFPERSCFSYHFSHKRCALYIHTQHVQCIGTTFCLQVIHKPSLQLVATCTFAFFGTVFYTRLSRVDRCVHILTRVSVVCICMNVCIHTCIMYARAHVCMCTCMCAYMGKGCSLWPWIVSVCKYCLCLNFYGEIFQGLLALISITIYVLTHKSKVYIIYMYHKLYTCTY